MKAIVKTKNKGSLNMREQPTSSGVIITKIPYGTTIEVVPVNDEWCSLVYSEHQGYIRREYIEEVEPDLVEDNLQEIYDDLKKLLKKLEKLLKK